MIRDVTPCNVSGSCLTISVEAGIYLPIVLLAAQQKYRNTSYKKNVIYTVQWLKMHYSIMAKVKPDSTLCNVSCNKNVARLYD